MRLPMSLVICILLAGPVSSQDSPYNLPIREHILDNGLRLLVLERPGSHRVACKIFTDMGALNETPGDLGVAHFLEHLMFKGTETLGTTDWNAEKPIIAEIFATEKALTDELNRNRNALRERGVFHDYRHSQSTPAIDSLRQALARLKEKNSRYRDFGAMMRWYQGFGGTKLTASTEQEYMKFDINLPRNRAALFMRVEADRMRNSVFREFDEELMILVEQRYGDLNRLSTPYFEAMDALVSTVHPVFWPEGHLTDFAQYTRYDHDVMYKRFFIPNNTTLIFVGGVTLEEMIPITEHYFGWMAREDEPPRVKAIEPIPQAEKRLLWRSDELQPRVEFRYMIPGVGHPDRPAFDVLGEVARLSLSQAFKKAGIRATVDINTRVVHTNRFGVPATLNMAAVLSAERNLNQAEGILIGVLEGLKSRVSSDHLALAKKRLRVQWHRTARDMDRLAFEIGHFQVMDSWRTLPKYLQAREGVNSDQIQRLARGYLTESNRNAGIIRAQESNPVERGEP